MERTVSAMDDELDKALRCSGHNMIFHYCDNLSCPYCKYSCSDNLHRCDTQALGRDAADAIARLTAQVPAWISVEERLPEFHEEVLVYAIGKEDAFTPVMAISEIYIFKLLPFSNGAIEWRDPWDYFNKNYTVTHWMPLPKPPDLT